MQECSPFGRQLFTHLQIAPASASLLYASGETVKISQDDARNSKKLEAF